MKSLVLVILLLDVAHAALRTSPPHVALRTPPPHAALRQAISTSHPIGRRHFSLLLPLALHALPLPAHAEDGKLLSNVGTAAERLARQGTNDRNDPNCASGIFLNFQPGRCTPAGNVYDALKKGDRPASDQASLDDLEADFLKKSGIGSPTPEPAERE